MIFPARQPCAESHARRGALGRLSGIVAHHIPSYLQRNRLPSWETNCIEDWETKVDAIVRETAGEDLRLISGIPSWVQMYFERLLEHTGRGQCAGGLPQILALCLRRCGLCALCRPVKELIGGEVDSVETYPPVRGSSRTRMAALGEGLLVMPTTELYLEFIPAEDTDVRTLGVWGSERWNWV